MGIYVVINLDVQPLSADLVFPVGLPAGSVIELSLVERPPAKVANEQLKFTLGFAYVNGAKVPVARNNYDRKYDVSYLSRSIKVKSPAVNGQTICQMKNVRLVQVPPPSAQVLETLSCQVVPVSEDAFGDAEGDPAVTEYEGTPKKVDPWGNADESAPSVHHGRGAAHTSAPTIFVCTKCSHQTFNKVQALAHTRSHLTNRKHAEATACGGRSENGLHICITCGRTFLSNEHLQTHLLNHTVASKLKCTEYFHTFPEETEVARDTCGTQPRFSSPFCSASYRTRRHLHTKRSHTSLPIICASVVHSNNRLTHQCVRCLLLFFKAADLKAHKRLCEAATPSKRKRREFVCPRCDLVTDNYAKLCDHCDVAHPESTPFHCDVCQKPFLHSAMLGRHALTHTDPVAAKAAPRLHPCTYCSKVFKSYGGIQTHTNSHLNRRPFECLKCGKFLSSPTKLRAHMVRFHGNTGDDAKCPHRPKGFPCKICGHYYETSAELVHHADSHTWALPFECTICHQCFKFHQGLLAHRRFYHGETISGIGDHTRSHVCDICHTRFKCRSSLAAHHLVKHADMAEKLTCAYCSRQFRSQHMLSLHIRSHTGEKPHVCQHCSKAFSILASLRNHCNQAHQGLQAVLPTVWKGAVSKIKLRQHLQQSHNAVPSRSIRAAPLMIPQDMAKDISDPVAHVIVKDPATIFS